MLITVSHPEKSQTRPDVYLFDLLTPGLTDEAVSVELIIFLSYLTLISNKI